jgi:two-component system, NtrC family, response regulator AtoC
MPPLRERTEDLPLLIDELIARGEYEGRGRIRLTPRCHASLVHYPWPGNVRELENMVRRMIVLGNEEAVLAEISRREPVPEDRADAGELLDLDALGRELAAGGELDLKAISKRAAQVAEKRVIERVLQKTRWNRKEASERLQISYKALLYKMKENGLSEGR